MPEPTDAWVGDKDGRTRGTCFAIDERRFLTCAHVVDEALGLKAPTTLDQVRGQEVKITYRATTAVAARVTATVVGYRPKFSPQSPANLNARRYSDIAILELTDAAAQARDSVGFVHNPAILANPWMLAEDREFNIYGPSDDGTRVEGDLRVNDEVDGRLLLLPKAAAANVRVEGGFSGAPVRDKQGVVLGMCVQANTATWQARAIPATVLDDVAFWDCGIVANVARPSTPPTLTNDALNILKDWRDQTTAILTTVKRVQVGQCPLYIANCSLEHSPSAFVRRVGYELAQLTGRDVPLTVYETAIPSADDPRWQGKPAEAYLNEAAEVYAPPLKDVLWKAIGSGVSVVHIPDIDVGKPDDVAAAIEICGLWHQALQRSRMNGRPFAIVLTTLNVCQSADLIRLKNDPRLSPNFAVGVLEPFHTVNLDDLQRWAKQVRRHRDRIKLEALVSGARKLIYGGRLELSMLEWCEGYEMNCGELLRS